MLNRRRGLLLPFALPFLIAGCLSDENNPSSDAGASLPEAGANDATTFDAGTSDAPLVDGGSDATIDAPVDAGPKAVTMTALKRGVPEPGVTVVFGDATGAVLSSATTGASGSVSQVVPAGSQVTVIFGTAAQPQLVTVQGVEPGDTLSANDDSDDQSLFEQVSVDAIPPTPPTGTASYTLSAGGQCFNSGVVAPPATLTIQDTCQSAGKFPLLIEAFDANAAPLGFSFVKGIALDPPEGGMPSITATGPWSTAVTSQTVTLSNVPTEDAGIAPGYLTLSEVVGGVALPSGNSLAFDGTVLDGGATSSTFRVHQAFADFVQEEATMRPIGSGGSAYNAIAKRIAVPTASATDAIDLAQLLPAITAASVDATSPSRPSVTWTSASSLSATDGIAILMQWSVAGGDSGRGTWLIIAPPSASTIKAPALPASLADHLPPDAQSVVSPPVVTAVDASFITGYPQFRAAATAVTPSKELIADFGTAIVPPLPTNGTLRITALTQNLD